MFPPQFFVEMMYGSGTYIENTFNMMETFLKEGMAVEKGQAEVDPVENDCDGDVRIAMLYFRIKDCLVW